MARRERGMVPEFIPHDAVIVAERRTRRLMRLCDEIYEMNCEKAGRVLTCVENTNIVISISGGRSLKTPAKYNKGE